MIDFQQVLQEYQGKGHIPKQKLSIKLESDIYRDMGVRPDVYELFEEGTDKRVLVIEVPGRPIGKVFKFEDVALMRVGEELKPMSEAMKRRILSGNRDFSSSSSESE